MDLDFLAALEVAMEVALDLAMVKRLVALLVVRGQVPVLAASPSIYTGHDLRPLYSRVACSRHRLTNQNIPNDEPIRD